MVGSDFLGCSIVSHEVNDPTLPLLVLLAVIYLTRRRNRHDGTSVVQPEKMAEPGLQNTE